MNQQIKIVLFDTEESYRNLLPLSYTRPVAEFRVGINRIVDKWRHFVDAVYSYYPPEYLQEKFPDRDRRGGGLVHRGQSASRCFYGRGRDVAWPRRGSARDSEGLWAFRGTLREFEEFPARSGVGNTTARRVVLNMCSTYSALIRPLSLRTMDGWCAAGSRRLPGAGTVVLGPDRDFPICPLSLYRGGCRGGMRCDKCEGRSGIYRPRCSGDGGKLSPRTARRLRQRQNPDGSQNLRRVYFRTFCKVGGEVDNAVFFGYSNKAHDGYLGNAVIGSGATSEREPIRPTLRTIIQGYVSGTMPRSPS